MTITSNDNHEEYEYWEYQFNNMDRRLRRIRQRRGRPPSDPTSVRAELTDFNDNISDFIPSYAASLDPLHFERRWIIESLGSFFRDDLITDVTRIVKGGKEANVYCCQANSATGVELIAAKLYRPRMLRHLRNDALYKEGRVLLDSDGEAIRGSREVRAMQKKTRFGKQLDFMNWIGHEFKVQTELHEAGADVPKPIAQRDNTILMAYIGDEWAPAPTLSEVTIEPDEAQTLFEKVIQNVKLMLAHHYVHSDLSAYNILYWEGQITIIDFPQLVDARNNQNAFMLLERDVSRIYQYFARHGVDDDPLELSLGLWQAYMNAVL